MNGRPVGLNLSLTQLKTKLRLEIERRHGMRWEKRKILMNYDEVRSISEFLTSYLDTHDKN